MNQMDHPEDWRVECKRGNYIFTDGPIQESDIENLITLFGDNWGAFVAPAESGRYLLDECAPDEWRAAALTDPDRWRVDVHGAQEFADEYPITEEQ
jgi:hypothetical protein